MEIPNRVEDFPHIDLARAPSSLARLSGGEQRFHQGPLLVRQNRMDTSFGTGILLTSLRTPLLMGYALTL